MVHVDAGVPVDAQPLGDRGGAGGGAPGGVPAGHGHHQVPAVFGQAEGLGGLGQVGDAGGAVEQRGGQQAGPVLPAPVHLPFDLPVGVGDEGAVLVDEVPHVGGDVHQQANVLGGGAGGLLDQALPHQGAAEPEGVQQGVERQSLFGPAGADPPGAAAGRVAGAARVEQRGDAVAQ